MPNLTPNYKLKKPIKEIENADIDVINGNMDIMDAEVKKISDKANLSESEILILKNKNIKEYLGTINMYSAKNNYVQKVDLEIDTTKYSALELEVLSISDLYVGGYPPKEKVIFAINNVKIYEYPKATLDGDIVRSEIYLNNLLNGYTYKNISIYQDNARIYLQPDFETINYTIPKNQKSILTLKQTINEQKTFNIKINVIGIY